MQLFSSDADAIFLTLEIDIHFRILSMAKFNTFKLHLKVLFGQTNVQTQPSLFGPYVYICTLKYFTINLFIIQ